MKEYSLVKAQTCMVERTAIAGETVAGMTNPARPEDQPVVCRATKGLQPISRLQYTPVAR